MGAGLGRGAQALADKTSNPFEALAGTQALAGGVGPQPRLESRLAGSPALPGGSAASCRNEMCHPDYGTKYSYMAGVH